MKYFFEYWTVTIVIPIMLILILLGAAGIL